MTTEAYYYKFFLFQRIKIITTLLISFLIFGFIILIYIIYLYFNPIDNIYNTNLLSSLGIIVSAFIASLSVMKSVYQNKKMNDDKFLLEQLTKCHSLAFIEFNELRYNLSKIENFGFINASNGESPTLGSLGYDIFEQFETKKEILELFGYIRCYFPHFLDELIKTISNLKTCTNTNELSKTIFSFLNIIEKEQLEYMINKKKIKFK